MRRDIFQAIADPTRRAIIALIALQAMTPNAIAENFNTTRQAVSKHLRILTECELVKQESQGREIYYSLEIEKMKEIDQWLEQYRKIWEGRFTPIGRTIIKHKKTKKMSTNSELDFTVDKAAKTVTIKREFDADLSLVWDAFTKAELLDQWLPPKPMTAKTKYQDFKVGGKRFYAMITPEGKELWSIQEYTSITPKTNFKMYNAFADKDENPELPGSEWDHTFSEENGNHKSEHQLFIMNRLKG